MDNPWKIRLLSGVLQGREVWLTEDRLTLGEHGCDLCIPLTQDEKISLFSKEGKLFVEAGQAQLRVNGRKYRHGMPLPDTGVLQVAGLTMAFGSQDSNLSSYKIPRSPLNYWLLGVMLLLLGGLLAELALLEIPEQNITSLPQRVDTLLQQTGLSHIRADWKQDGSLLLSGYCQHGAQMQAALLTFDSWGVMYRDNVVCADQLVRDVQDVLMQAGYADAQVIGQSPGDVVIRANIVMGQRWNKVQPLLAELPGLKHWQIENPHQAQSQAIITTLVQKGLAGLVSVTPINQAFVVSGVLDQSHKQLLQQTLTGLRQQYPALMLSYQEVPASNEGDKYLPAPIAGFVQGRHGEYLLLTDGQRLQLGSQLPAGGEIVALTPQAVAISYQGALINCPLNF